MNDIKANLKLVKSKLSIVFDFKEQEMVECHNRTQERLETHLNTILQDCIKEKEDGGFPLVFVYVIGRSVLEGKSEVLLCGGDGKGLDYEKYVEQFRKAGSYVIRISDCCRVQLESGT